MSVGEICGPIFFIISGYFWGVKVRQGLLIKLTTRMLRRLLLLFFGWSLIYLLPYNLPFIYQYGLLGTLKNSYENLAYIISNPVTFTLEGAAPHLWFLMALLLAVIITSFFVYRSLIKSLIIIALFLYLFGLIVNAYSSTPIGIYVNFNTRNGPFFSTLFFVTGYLLSKYKINSRWLLIGLSVWLIGCLAHFSEIYCLVKYFNTTSVLGYVVGTYFMGLGATLVALSNHHLFKSIPLHEIGKSTLGIYACHYIFVYLLQPVGKIASLHGNWFIRSWYLLCLSLQSQCYQKTNTPRHL
jgi:surface polysaccharide O-acyltransferase-like enzyme